MSELSEQTIASEPIDPGTDPIQGVGAPIDATAITKAKARGPLEGHALPETLRDLAPAFRSHPAWILICQWTGQVMEDHQNTKTELAEVKGKLETAQSEIVERKIKNAELTQKLALSEKTYNYKARWQAMGTFFLGLSPAAYINTFPIYGYLLGGVGFVFLYFAWREDSGS